MTTYLQVRLTPWAKQRIVKTYCKTDRITKTAIRQSLKDLPGTEFHTIPTPTERGGQVVTVEEAHAQGVDVIEVRYNNDRDLAMITIHPTGRFIVS